MPASPGARKAAPAARPPSLQVTAQSSPALRDTRLCAHRRRALPNPPPPCAPALPGPDPLPGGRGARHHPRRHGAERGVWGRPQARTTSRGKRKLRRRRRRRRVSPDRAGAAGRRKVRAEEAAGGRGGGVHRCAQIREAFLASQWQLRAGRRGACAGGSVAAAEEAAPGLAGVPGCGGRGGGAGSARLPQSPGRVLGVLLAGPRGLCGGRAGAGCTPLSSSPQPSCQRALEVGRGVAPLPSLRFPHLLGHSSGPV